MNSKNKKITILFFLWFLLSLSIIYIYYTGNTQFGWIDIPTHFFAGFLIALIISWKDKKINLKKVFILSFLIFLTWELIELTVSTFSHNEFVINISKETSENKTQDMIMDILGFIGFAIT